MLHEAMQGSLHVCLKCYVAAAAAAGAVEIIQLCRVVAEVFGKSIEMLSGTALDMNYWCAMQISRKEMSVEFMLFEY